MKYLQLVEELKGYREEEFACFQKKLIPTKQKIIGVRTPIMRKIAKKYASETETIFSFPDEYFEVTFIKLTTVSLLPYENFVSCVEDCVGLIDNWATCDCFKAKSIAKNKEAFLPILERIFIRGGEFDRRYVLVTLLSFYIEEKFLPLIESYITRAVDEAYYIRMSVAWLTAEILVKYYDYGVALLQKGILEEKTHNKAIQKAIESYRLNQKQKEQLRSLKIKKKR